MKKNKEKTLTECALEMKKESEPTNKFEVGDEVLFKEDTKKYEAEIFGITKDNLGVVAAIQFKVENKHHFRIIRDVDFYLSPLKKKDELKVGDKFIDYASKTVKVLAVDYCEQKNKIMYFGKRENGYVHCWTENDVHKIIYE